MNIKYKHVPRHSISKQKSVETLTSSDESKHSDTKGEKKSAFKLDEDALRDSTEATKKFSKYERGAVSFDSPDIQSVKTEPNQYLDGKYRHSALKPMTYDLEKDQESYQFSFVTQVKTDNVELGVESHILNKKSKYLAISQNKQMKGQDIEEIEFKIDHSGCIDLQETGKGIKFDYELISVQEPLSGKNYDGNYLHPEIAPLRKEASDSSNANFLEENKTQGVESPSNLGGHGLNSLPASNNQIQGSNAVPDLNVNRITCGERIWNMPGVLMIPTDPNLRRYYGPEVRIYLTKLIGILVANILISFTILGTINHILPFQVICAPILGYLLFNSIVDGFWKRQVLEDVWITSDDMFQTIDSLSGFVSISWILLRLVHLLPFSIIACVPIGLAALTYAAFSGSALKTKLFRFLTKCGYVVQIVLFTFKIDEIVNWNWEIIMLPILLFLTFKSLGCFKYALRLFSVVISNYNRPREQRDSDINLKLIGFSWYFMYYTLSLVIIFGLVSSFSLSESKKELTISASINIGISCLLLLSLIVIYNTLDEFVTTYGIIRSLQAVYEAQYPKKEVKKVSLQTEKKSSYFVMLSSTYFQPLQKKFLGKPKKRLQRIRKVLNSVQMAKPDFAPTDTEACEINLRKRASKTLKAINTDRGDIDDVNRDSKSFNMNYICLSPKAGLSVNDIDQIKILDSESSPKKSKDDENLCHLCYSNFPDAILLGCGHGGICYECATLLVHKKNECMECREKVDAICRVDPNCKIPNTIKGVEISKVVVS